MTAIIKKKPEDGGEKLARLDELAGELPIFTEDDYVTSTKVTPSGSITLDLAIGIGGYPSGCIIDTFGAESAGKSLLSIMAMAQVQKAGGVVVVWDVERSYSKNTAWLKVNGVDTRKLRFIRLEPDQGCERGMASVEQIAQAGAADLIVVDSIPAMVPQASLDKGMDERDIVSATANVLTRHLKRLVGILDKSKTTVMFINQMRANMNAGPYGDPTKETSIFALKHQASVRMKVTKMAGKENLRMENGVPIGHRVRVKIVKNKVAAPYRTAEFDILYTKGVDQASEIADIMIGGKLVKKSGAFIEMDGLKFQGMAKFVEHIRDPKNFDKCLARAKALADKMTAFGVQEDSRGADGGLTVEEGADE